MEEYFLLVVETGRTAGRSDWSPRNRTLLGAVSLRMSRAEKNCSVVICADARVRNEQWWLQMTHRLCPGSPSQRAEQTQLIRRRTETMPFPEARKSSLLRRFPMDWIVYVQQQSAGWYVICLCERGMRRYLTKPLPAV